MTRVYLTAMQKNCSCGRHFELAKLAAGGPSCKMKPCPQGQYQWNVILSLSVLRLHFAVLWNGIARMRM